MNQESYTGVSEASYPGFGKIPRWEREIVVTEKIDGTNALIAIKATSQDWFDVLGHWRRWPPRYAQAAGHEIAAGGRRTWLTPEADNHGFAAWVWANAEQLASLGPGRHYGEWYGQKVNRSYDLKEKRFMLFNVGRWTSEEGVKRLAEVGMPQVEVATVLTKTTPHALASELPALLGRLELEGSFHVPGYMNPEGVIIYHTAGNNLYKATLGGDGHKGVPQVASVSPKKRTHVKDSAAQALQAVHEFHGRKA